MTMQKKTTFALAALFSVAALFLLACGSGGGSPATDVPRTTCKPAQAPVFGTPADLAPNQKEFQSADRGYVARYPSDWEPRPDMLNQGSDLEGDAITGDAFLGPGVGQSVRVNISVACHTVPIGTGSRDFTDALMEVLRQSFGGSPSTATNIQVDGKDAYRAEYVIRGQQTPESLNIEKIEVIFADERGGWDISLVVPEGQLATYTPIFDAFVASFHEQ